ncbi:MAG: hypothetical protein ACD_2C00248G0008 [uncultured bacterium (gcode 4)]|uniref:Uncharacterized protein n=1 Tax=uncultured bacterium (gcode 4) TaxID=1234023 RepID=K2GZR1_9BACT|nr:MAG: hypothetical protein ACD_2C00248G0008 [uncultured bacterium (gcode 4)]
MVKSSDINSRSLQTAVPKTQGWELQGIIHQTWANVSDALLWWESHSLNENWENLEIETSNFKVTSNWWEIRESRFWKIKINPENDICEIMEWEFSGEQLFTQKAMLRELTKVWKKVPSIKEWRELIRAIDPDLELSSEWQNNTSARKALWIRLCWVFNNQDNTVYFTWISWSLWASDEGASIDFDRDRIIIDQDKDEFGLSVRCFK